MNRREVLRSVGYVGLIMGGVGVVSQGADAVHVLLQEQEIAALDEDITETEALITSASVEGNTIEVEEQRDNLVDYQTRHAQELEEYQENGGYSAFKRKLIFTGIAGVVAGASMGAYAVGLENEEFPDWEKVVFQGRTPHKI